MKNKEANCNENYHKPVLREEAIEALRINPEGTYVDATFGGGGHSRAILHQLVGGQLIGFDQDEDAKSNVLDNEHFLLINENFRYLKRFLRVEGITAVSGILADLGVSSYQFDTADRGFSIRMDAPLDMRMDKRGDVTAGDIVRSYEEEQLLYLFEKYGEIRNAKTLAAHLVKMRKQFPLKTIGELKNVITPVIKGNKRRYLAQVFQALRIEVNDELGALEDLLAQAEDVLAPGGRLVVITFHSVEDRVVKQFLKQKQSLHAVFKKPVVPTKDEVRINSRAASAKMRVAEKIVVNKRRD